MAASQPVFFIVTFRLFSVLLLFCLYCYGDHRDLHSFPTRRSSDLGAEDHLLKRDPWRGGVHDPAQAKRQDRKSTRLNSSHVASSYAGFCLKKTNGQATGARAYHAHGKKARGNRSTSY